MPINQDIVMSRIKRLEECLFRLKRIAKMEIEDFLSSDDLQDIAERNIQIAAQCCIDMSNHIISSKKLPFPEGYGDAFLELYKASILDKDTAEEMSRIAGFRNILVHDYLKVDHEVVYANLQSLDVFEEFVKQINSSILD